MILPHKTYINNTEFPWIVLINGLFSDLEAWNSAIEQLGEYNVLVYNGRGQGDGPTLQEPYTLDQQVSDLDNLLIYNKISNAALLGLSNGGRVALKFASLFPQKIWALVACDTYANITPMIKLKLESWLKAHEHGGALLRFDVATPWIWGEELVKSNPELVQFYRNKSEQADDGSVLNLIRGALHSCIDLTRIITPTLLIAGEEDLLTPVLHHKKLQKEINGATLKVVPGGHASLFEYPETISKAIVPFLRSQHELG